MSRSTRTKDTLEFLHSMLGEMRRMSRDEGCDMLTYFVEQAYIEVDEILKGDRPFNTRTGAKLKWPQDASAKVSGETATQSRPAA